ncbi:MAG: hypothetical protein J6A44_05425 [Paludibacteraceae bacterium]|nr:hypothetical protein [Paludibacteraceae bacterium]
MEKRRIGFFNLYCIEGEKILNVVDILVKTLRFIANQTNKLKKKDLPDDRICFLDFYNYDEEKGLIKILFKSARHSYRAPLLNRNTIELRENPKTKDEGEQVKTHLLIKFVEGDAIVFLETGRNILSMKVITEYLNTFISIYNSKHKKEYIEGHFRFNMIPRDDFREVLESMQRVTFAEVFIDKHILGGDALNFSDRIEHVQEDIAISLKTVKKESIKQTIYDILSKIIGGRTDIKRIRIKGKMSDSSESIIDTDFIVKKEYIEAQQSEETGEYNTQYMFSQLELLANKF